MAAREKHAVEEPLRQKIERRAYEIWQTEGHPHGRDVDHWIRAEAEMTVAAVLPTPASRLQPPPSHATSKVKPTGSRARTSSRGKSSRS